MSPRILPLSLLLACVALLTAACAMNRDRAPHPAIAKLWRGYRDMAPERAIAIAGDLDVKWVGAASGGHPSRIEAERSVLAACSRRRAARRMQAPCRLYATGDEIVWEKR